jgi:putative spermidine/putrescine transport system substrate-binding protein
VPDVNLAKIKAMVDAKNVEWDVVQAIGMWVPQKTSSGELWEALDYSKIATDGVPKEMVETHGVAVATFAQTLAYNTDAFPAGKRPNSWADFFDTAKFPGKRGMLNQPRYSLEIGVMADGVAMDKVYPVDVDRSLKRWDTIKNNVLFWEQWPQAPTLLASGELAMSLSSQARILGLLQEEKNAPIALVWNQGIMTIDYLSVPKGAKRKDNAFKLISWMLDAKRQADYAKDTAVGPSNAKALELVDEKTREVLPSYHYQKGELVGVDSIWWAANLEKLTERWNQWKLKN